MGNEVSISTLYDSTFLDQFGENSTVLEEVTYSESNPSIDVKQIAEKLGITIKFDLMTESGKVEGTTIFVSLFDPEVRQRFTIAHELGHFLLHKPEKTMFRDSDLERYDDILERIKEREANGFAAELLMPKSLLQQQINKYLSEKQWGTELDNIQFDILLSDISSILNVSKSSLEYRLKNSGLVVE